MFADLHLHSLFSDGTYTPEEMAGYGAQHGLRALSLTDHDTVEGCQRMAAACAHRGLTFLPGIELTAEHRGQEVHLLGYCLDVTHPPLLAATARFQEVRQNRIREIADRLRNTNVVLQAEAVFAIAQCRSPGRPHVARALVQAGVCQTVDEAFERFLKRNRRAWVPKFRISATAAIELLHQARGLAVMAHPGLTHADSLIPDLAAAGMDGLECYHTKHTDGAVEHYLGLAHTHQLLPTGGSDCHGMSKGRPLIGTVKVPYAHVERLLACWAERSRGLADASNLGSPQLAGTESQAPPGF